MKKEISNLVEFKTTLGDFTVRLYDDTPKHRDNFLKLVSEGYYDGLLFHRVINDFMVQAGDPDSRNATPGAMLGGGDPGYTVEAEIDYPKHYHKYGALAAARTGDQFNPERRSSGSQFYVVTGQKYSERQLDNMQTQLSNTRRRDYFNKLQKENFDTIRAMRMRKDSVGLEDLRQRLIARTEDAVGEVALPDSLRRDYMEKGGTPHLDGQYTVFGEVVSGMETIEKIQKVETGSGDRPKEDVRILSAKILDPHKNNL